MRRCATRSSGVPAPQTTIAFADRLTGGREPLFPLPWALGFTVGVQQQPSAERAAAVLDSQEPQRGRAQRGWLTASPPVPVVGQRRIVWRRRRCHHPVPDDRCPGELTQVEAAGATAEDPLVSPGGVEHAEVLGAHPVPRLVRVREPGPLVDQPPQVHIQRAEGAFGHPDPVVAAHPVMIGLSLAMSASALAPRRAFASADNRLRIRRSASLLGLVSSLPLG